MINPWTRKLPDFRRMLPGTPQYNDYMGRSNNKETGIDIQPAPVVAAPVLADQSIPASQQEDITLQQHPRGHMSGFEDDAPIGDTSVTQTTTKAPQRINPYLMLNGVKSAAGLLAGMVDRGRQNQYMYNQFSTMGQLDPIPASNYQPNPFSLYAKYGGSLKKYQQGGTKMLNMQEEIAAINAGKRTLPYDGPAFNREAWLKHIGQFDAAPVQQVQKKQSKIITGTKADLDKLSSESPMIQDKDGLYRNDLGKVFKLDEIQGKIAYNKTQNPNEMKSRGYRLDQSNGWNWVKDTPKQQSKQLPPIYTRDANDPALKRYNDSTTLYNSTVGEFDKFDKMTSDEWMNHTRQWSSKNKPAIDAYLRLEKTNNKTPTGVERKKTGVDYSNVATEYKKPVQPVIYQPWQRLPNGQTIDTPNNVPSVSAPQEIVGNPVPLQQPTDGDWSATSMMPGYLNQSTMKFRNKKEWEDYIAAQREVGNDATSTNWGTNSGTASFNRFRKGGKWRGKKC